MCPRRPGVENAGLLSEVPPGPSPFTAPSFSRTKEQRDSERTIQARPVPEGPMTIARQFTGGNT